MIDLNIEAYDAEALRKLVRLLEHENRILKDKLKKENIPYDEVNPFEETIDNMEEYDPDQGERIVAPPFLTLLACKGVTKIRRTCCMLVQSGSLYAKL